MIKMPTRTVIVGNDKERLKYLDDDNDAVKGDDRGDDKERLKVLMTIMPTRAMIMRTMGLSKMLTMISMLKNNDDNVGDNDRSRQAVSTVRAVKLEFGKENRSCGGPHHLSQMISVRSLKRPE